MQTAIKKGTIALAILFGINFSLRSQPATLEPMSGDAISTNGTFWSLSGNFPPSPFNPLPQLPLYTDGTPGKYWVDDRASVNCSDAGSMSFSTNSFALSARAETLEPMSSDAMSTNGIFWSMSGNLPPSPFDPLPQLSLFTDGTPGNYWYDDSDIDYQAYWAQVSAEANTPCNALAALPGDGGVGTTLSGGGSFSYGASVSQDGLWLQITGITNAIVSLNLNNATDTVYEVWSTTDLSATNWNIEQEVFPTNQQMMPFTVAEQGRPNLMVWAEDWTGITSNGNDTPEWWFYEYFGTVDLSDTNLDVNGNTLLYDYQNGIDPNIITGLWLQITGITNGTVSFALNNATDLVYEVWSATSLSNPVPWNIEQAVWPGTNQTSTPFTVQVQDRTNGLFLWARDWTGITSNGNQTPEWWFWEYFGTVDMFDSDLDTVGKTLLYDYQNSLDPNVISFAVNATNQYFNTSSATARITVSRGAPSYMAVLVDSTNFSAATWTPYNSNADINLGAVEGWHSVWVGLKGLPQAAQQTWEQIELKLILTPPVLILTNPIAGIVTQPMIELQGFCSEPLSSFTFDLSNAAGLITNQQVLVLSQYYDANAGGFTSNTFQAFDVPLTNGDNVVTFHATDMAGNITTTNFTYTLDYSGKTNPPAIQVYWPQNGDHVSGTEFTLRGSLDDFTASLTAQIVDASGHTHTLQGLVERNGFFWVENAPFLDGTNYVTLAAMDAVGNISTTNLTISVSAGLTIDDFPGGLGGTERNVIPIVTGTVVLTNYTIWVNGVQATQDGQGNWEADSVPLGPGGTALVEARAIPSSDNNGNRTGSAPSPDATPGNPASPDSLSAEMQIDQPAAWYMQEYQYRQRFTMTQYLDGGGEIQQTDTGQVDDVYMNGGTANAYQCVSGDEEFDGWLNWAFTWPCDQCPATQVYTDSDGDYDSGQVSVWSAVDAAQGYCIFKGMQMAEWDWSQHIPWTLSYESYIEDQTQSICSQMTLQTGGKGVAGLQNLFEIDISAVNWQTCGGFNPYFSPYPTWCSNAIPPAETTVHGNTPDSAGRIFAALPQNVPLDITPQAPAQRYTYSVNPTLYTPVWQCLATIPTNTTRTTIGVGEQVGLGFSPSLSTSATWTVSGGASLSTNIGKSVTLTAPGNAGSVTVSATIGSVKVQFPPFTVVEPATAKGQIYSIDSFPSGTQGVGMVLAVTYFPTNVSFSRVQVLELACPAINVTGCFTNIPASNLVHPATTNWTTLSLYNQTTDHAAFESFPQPWYPGEFDWNIPVIWQVLGSSTTNSFGNFLQQQILDSTDGTSTVKKLGVQTTRTP